MVFMGTPSFAVPALRAVASRCDVAAVITRPDRPQGRGRVSEPSAIAAVARELGLTLLQPERVSTAATQERLATIGAQLFAVVAFGEILSPEVLATAPLGSINLHGSLLPEYRGASPVQRALWDGRSATGVTTLYMDSGVDTGDVILQRWVAIEAEDDAARLAARLAEVGGPLLAQSLLLAARGEAPRRSQDRTAGSYARKLVKADGIVDWTLDAETVWNHQRAVTPWPGAATALRGRPLIVTRSEPAHRLVVDQAPGTILALLADGVEIACGSGALRMRRVKAEGKAEMPAADWARGARVRTGDRLLIEREAHA